MTTPSKTRPIGSAARASLRTHVGPSAENAGVRDAAATAFSEAFSDANSGLGWRVTTGASCRSPAWSSNRAMSWPAAYSVSGCSISSIDGKRSLASRFMARSIRLATPSGRSGRTVVTEGSSVSTRAFICWPAVRKPSASSGVVPATKRNSVAPNE